MRTADMWTCFKQLILAFFLTLPITAVCQTGFFLSFPCMKGDANLKKFHPAKENLCLVGSPILTMDDISSINTLDEKGRSVIEMKLTADGFKRLRLAVGLTPLIAFMVDNEIMFVLDTETTELHEIIRIYQVDNPITFFRWRELLKNMKAQG
jgi:hypothetical protein